jgi:stringent starvation protein B
MQKGGQGREVFANAGLTVLLLSWLREKETSPAFTSNSPAVEIPTGFANDAVVVIAIAATAVKANAFNFIVISS